MTTMKNNDGATDSDAAAAAAPSSPPLPYGLIAPLAVISFIDSISYMVIAPSLVFYVLEVGGTKDLYGIAGSAFSFASFSFKPVLGRWSDRAGGKFRAPYFTSLILAAAGGFLYFLASAFSSTAVAITLIMVGRLLGGCGGANSTLGFTYVAQAVPKEKLTQANAVLSMVRVLGMALAPSFNVFLDRIHFDVRLGANAKIAVTPLNSVGLLLLAINVLALVVLFLFLQEPPSSAKRGDCDKSSSKQECEGREQQEARGWQFWRAVLCLEILIPSLALFTMNANFQLMETGLAPAANDALGWGPVGVSTVFGANAIYIFFVILLTFQLSAAGVTDEVMLIIGLIASVLGYLSMYLLWARGTNMWLFTVPIAMAATAFPFMGAPSRSIFTRAVDNIQVLRHHQGTMQALLSMVVSIAGFTAPSFIATWIIRTPEQVEATPRKREFSPYALFAPILSLVVLVGILYIQLTKMEDDSSTTTAAALPEDDAENRPPPLNDAPAVAPKETTSLLLLPHRRHTAPVHLPSDRSSEFDPRTDACRRESVSLMGISQICHARNKKCSGGKLQSHILV